MTGATLSVDDAAKLAAFRNAARQVRDASVIARAKTIETAVAPGAPGFVDVYVRLLDSEPFRSLAMALRLVYLQSEPANFYSVCNVLARIGHVAAKAGAARLRTEYSAAFRDTSNDVRVGDGGSPDPVLGDDVFDAWLNGIAFHQDIALQPLVKRLLTVETHFTWSVQAIGLQVAGRVMDLDDEIADFLAEQRLPRIQPETAKA